MRFNHMTKDNEKKKDLSKYIMWAIVLAFVCFFFLNVLTKLIIIFSKVLFEYWYVAIIIVLIIIFFKKIRRKKK